MRTYSFWFHYNRPASAKAGRPVLTVHFKKACYLVYGVAIQVPTVSRIRKTQPRCVIAGKASRVEIIDGLAVIS